MHPPPPLSQSPRYPITTCILALALVAAFRCLNGHDINPVFLSNAGDCLREPWRLFTATFFHIGPLHLIFNLYWVWVFGTLIEGRFGHAAMLGIFVFLAAGSMAAELAFFHGGVGLSGVGYGLFGMLWVLSSRDNRLCGAVDRQTVQLFVAWFFFCIITTITNWFPVANVAHGAGCALGALLGWTISVRQFSRRLQRVAITAAVFILCIVGGTVARPYVNLTDSVGHDLANRGYEALKKGDNSQAAKLYEQAVAIDPNVFGWWNNLGIAYRDLGRPIEAAKAFRRAKALNPDRPALE
jgi:membrane associated rhomboid family serine protease